ncbi:MAG: hypothetical protein FIB02_12000 [Desulfuromonas sp.]|nr:hypothetical protein [Desulfuromonas sp.]
MRPLPQCRLLQRLPREDAVMAGGIQIVLALLVAGWPIVGWAKAERCPTNRVGRWVTPHAWADRGGRVPRNVRLTHPTMALLMVMIAMGLLAATPGHAREVSRAAGNLLLTPSHGGDGSAWGMADCKMCHPFKVIHQTATDIKGIVERKGYGSCSGCHGGNGTGAGRRCVVCHNSVDMPASPRRQGPNGHDFTLKHRRALKDRHCLACHRNSDMDGSFEPAVDLSKLVDDNGDRAPASTITRFCLRCHNRDHQQKGYKIKPRAERGLGDPLVAMADNYRFTDKHGFLAGTGDSLYVGLRQSKYRYVSTKPVECTDCHAMHGTTNPKLIIGSSNVGATDLPTSFRSTPYKVKVSGGNYSDLCVLCHVMESVAQGGCEAGSGVTVIEEGCLRTGNGLQGVHDASNDCEECHRHGEAVEAGL